MPGMRLDVLDHGQQRRAKLFTGMTRRMSGVDMADVVLTLLYRPSFYGGPMLDLTVDVMRGDSPWSVAEREYLAHATAETHECSYCADTHGEIVRLAAKGPLTTTPGLTATAEMLTHVTRNEPVDLAPARDAGVSDKAIRDAFYLNFVWNIVNRLALAFGYELRPGQLEAGAKALYRFGYRLPSFLVGSRPAVQAADRKAALVANLVATVVDGEGVTGRQDRSAAATGAELPEPWQPYITLVREAANRITDADVDKLRRAGHNEDEIFEMTVAAAVGASHQSLNRALAART